MLDFYGKELSVGDKVLYGTGYAALKEGVVERINEDKGFISIRCYRSQNGVQSRVKYYNELTGKWINPWHHRAQEAGSYHKETGLKLTSAQVSKYTYGNNYYERSPNPEYVPEELREWRDTEYKDYVKEVELRGGYISVIYNSKGIVKLEDPQS